MRLTPWLGPAVLGWYIYVNQAGTWIELPSNWVWAGLFETAVLAILLVGWGLSVRQTMAGPAMAVVCCELPQLRHVRLNGGRSLTEVCWVLA